MENDEKISKPDLLNYNNCPLMHALNIIGGKWKLPIIWALNSHGTLRYNELRKQVCGITNMMLSQSLQELQDHNLVKRVQYMEIPPRVEYSLTEAGESLLPAVDELATWGRAQQRSIKFE